MATFNRYDICNAYYLYAVGWHGGKEDAYFGRLDKIGYRPEPGLCNLSLSENAQEIYDNLLARAGYEPELCKGQYVSVEKHRQNPAYTGPKRELEYPSFTGILLDYAGTCRGWDVVEVEREDDGEVVSVYCFSLERCRDPSGTD